MKNKMIAYGMLCLLLIGTLEGCGRKKTNVITEKESYEEAGNSLAALREAEQWTDTWSFVDAKGKEQTVSIDAKIVVPDMESMLADRKDWQTICMFLRWEKRLRRRIRFPMNADIPWRRQKNWRKAS